MPRAACPLSRQCGSRDDGIMRVQEGKGSDRERGQRQRRANEQSGVDRRGLRRRMTTRATRSEPAVRREKVVRRPGRVRSRSVRRNDFRTVARRSAPFEQHDIVRVDLGEGIGSPSGMRYATGDMTEERPKRNRGEEQPPRVPDRGCGRTRRRPDVCEGWRRVGRGVGTLFDADRWLHGRGRSVHQPARCIGCVGTHRRGRT